MRVSVLLLFLAVSWVGFVIVVYPDHTHMFFRTAKTLKMQLALFMTVVIPPANVAGRLSASRVFVSPAKHGRHIGIMSLSSTLLHFWFPIDYF